MLKIDEILSNENQKNALEHFRTKRDGCSLDGMLLSELEEYWIINGECICEQMYITRLIAQKFRKHIEPYFLPDSYAYQEGKGVMEAILKVKEYVEHEKLKWVRYADNIYFFSDEFDAVVKIYNQLSKYLSEHFFLEINLSKSGVFKASERIIMGYDIIQTGNHVDIRKHIYREKKCYLKWHDCRLHTSGGKYHIVSDGIINREDYSVLFENEQKKHIIPVEVTNQINIYSNVILASNVLNKMNEKRIRIHFFDKNGRLTGCFVPENTRGYSNILLKQCEVYLNEQSRLDIARRIEIASLHNIRSNLRYYKKQGNGIYEEAINTCISFGNTLLYNEFLSIIKKYVIL